MGSVDECSCHFPTVTNSETEHAHPTKTGDFQYPANPTPATGVAVNLPPVATTPTAEYAFPVLEEHKGTAGPKDVKVTLPNKARLTPLSIMVCDTISAVRSRMLLKCCLTQGQQPPSFPASVYQDIASHARPQETAALIHLQDHARLTK